MTSSRLLILLLIYVRCHRATYWLPIESGGVCNRDIRVVRASVAPGHTGTGRVVEGKPWTEGLLL